MTKYITRWNVGYGNSYDIVEAGSQSEADDLAYERWREESESGADYQPLEYTQENCEDYDLEWEE